MLVDEEEDNPPTPSTTDETTPVLDSDMEISINALTGQLGIHTIRILKTIKCTNVVILIDSGSTHSFIDPSTAQRAGCSTDPTAHLLVGITNGDKAISRGICTNLQWSMQSHSFTHTIRLLP